MVHYLEFWIIPWQLIMWAWLPRKAILSPIEIACGLHGLRTVYRNLTQTNLYNKEFDTIALVQLETPTILCLMTLLEAHTVDIQLTSAFWNHLVSWEYSIGRGAFLNTWKPPGMFWNLFESGNPLLLDALIGSFDFLRLKSDSELSNKCRHNFYPNEIHIIIP